MSAIHTFQCPVCAFSGMDEPPIDHAICACCGTHFGYDDTTKTYQRLRNEWLSKGGHWFDTEDTAYPPYGLGWNAWDQLDLAQFRYGVPRPASVMDNSVENLLFNIDLGGFRYEANLGMTVTYA